jgi:hypothetical protein
MVARRVGRHGKETAWKAVGMNLMINQRSVQLVLLKSGREAA